MVCTTCVSAQLSGHHNSKEIKAGLFCNIPWTDQLHKIVRSNVLQ